MKMSYRIKITSVLLISFAVSLNAQYAYVANLGDNTISVVNLANNAVSTTIGVGVTPEGVALNPAGTLAFVTDFNGNNVSVINTVTNKVTGTIQVGPPSTPTSPYGVAFNPMGSWAYVTNNLTDEVSVINLANNTVASTVAVGISPYGIAVNSAGTFAYVANYASDTVSVMNTSTYAVSSVAAGTWPIGIAVNPAGTVAYATNNGSANVSVINTGNNSVTATVAVGNGPKGIAVSPDGSLVFVVNNSDNTVSVIAAASNTVTATLNVGNGPVAVAFNAAGTYAYVTNDGDNTVSVINTATQATVATVHVGNNPTGVAVGGPQSLSINTGGIVNAGSFAAPVAPGGLASVFGVFPVGTGQASAVPWPTSLSGLSMQFIEATRLTEASVAAPFYYASSTQANVQVPWEFAGQSQASVTATVGADTSAAQSVAVVPAAPGIFVLNAQGQGAITDQSNNVSNASNPATAGVTYVSVYCTGLGPVSNQPATGAAASSTTLSYATLPVTVAIGGISVTPYFAGLAPGFVGVNQINVLIPAGVAAGSAVPMTVTVNGVTSNTVTLAVQH